MRVTGTKPLSSTAGYGEAADTLVEQYESVSFADVHGDVLHLFPVHLDALQRALAMKSITDMLAREGRVVLSLRHGPVPAGRRMFDVSVRETVDLARGHGLRAVHHSEREDPHARQGVRWSYLGLQQETAADTPVQRGQRRSSRFHRSS